MRFWFYALAIVLMVSIFLFINKSIEPNSTPSTSADLLKTDPETVERLYTLHRFVDNLFEKEQIPYFAVAGTILGAVRHGGIIPWDDDLDVALFEEDLPRVYELRDTLIKNGYDIAVFGGGVKIFCLEGIEIANPEMENTYYEWKFPWIDLFLMEIDGDGKVVYAVDRIREAFGQREWFYQEDVVAGLRRLPFGFSTIPVPSQWIDYLNRVYGPDWNTIAYKDYDHSKEQKLEKVAVPIVDFRIPLIR